MPHKKCTREQIRELDRRAIEDYGMPGTILMENAGRGAADICVEMLGEPSEKHVLVFCGKGNNGGDGFVIARHLHNRGANVLVMLTCARDQIYPESDAGINLEIATRMKLPILSADTDERRLRAESAVKQSDLLVDALLGTGLSGDVREPHLSLIHLINAADKPVLSVDIPSGLDANTGMVLRAAVRAHRTVTFALPKVGFTLGDGPKHTGKVTVVDIGLPVELVQEIS